MKYPGVLEDVIIAVAWLSVKSPLLYPPEHEAQARRVHAKLAHPMGDLLTDIGIVHKYNDAELKKEFCHKNFLDPDTMAFIAKSTTQIIDIGETVGLVGQPDGNENDVIRSFLSAYGDQCLVLKGRSYVTPMDVNVVLHPSSSLYASMPKIIVALEFIQSSRTYAEEASAVRSTWLKEYGISLDFSQDSSRPGRGAYQEFGADRKKQRRFERSRAALGYTEESFKRVQKGFDPKAANSVTSVTSSGRKLFRVQKANTYGEDLRSRGEAVRAKANDRSVPNELVIGGRTLKCSNVSQKPVILMSIDDLRAIAPNQPVTDHTSWLGYRVSLRDNTGKYEILRGYRLGEIVEVARILGLLDGKLQVPDTIPIGASLSARSNIKVLLKALPFIAHCHVGTRGKNGWLTLTGNEEIFWFEFNDSPTDALDYSLSALDTISDYVREADLLEQLSNATQKLAECLKRIKAAVVKNL